VLRDGHRIADGHDVMITGGETPVGSRVIASPPADPALVGQANRTLAARGVPWRWGLTAPPGPINAPDIAAIQDVQVIRRYRLETTGSEPATDDVLATVNGEPWLVRAGNVVMIASRLDTSWTRFPTSPGFVPFLDALVNRIVAGEADVSTAEGPPHVEFQVRGTDTVGATVFGPDPRESDLTPAPQGVAVAALGGKDHAELLSDARFASERFAGTRRADASGMLLALALLIAAVELAVATRTR
jgi:hypothetical protein